jgi:proteasome lid subunit RPN8/RPN11
MTIELKPEQSHVIDQAIAAGLIDHPDEVVKVGVETLRNRLESNMASARSMSAEEWMQKFRAWAHSHPTTTPLLSDEAVSRESIYGERGL